MIRDRQTFFSYIAYSLPIIFAGILFFIWNNTHPSTVGPLGILVVFIMLYGFWTTLFFIIVHLLLTFFHHNTLFQRLFRRSITQANYKKRASVAYYTASILAFAPVLLLAMQSVNQLSIRDIGLVFLFVGLAIFYMIRRI